MQIKKTEGEGFPCGKIPDGIFLRARTRGFCLLKTLFSQTKTSLRPSNPGTT